MSIRASPSNRVLAGLSAATRRRLRLVPVTLNHGDVLYEQDAPMKDVYFPRGSLVSLLTIIDSNMALEVGMVGLEGMVGSSAAVGFPKSPVRALVQGSGAAMRTTTGRFREVLRRDRQLQAEVARCAYVSMATAMRISGCNQSHEVQARLARWLLMTRDRLGVNDLPLTQEFLAGMLGVQREGVSRAAGALQRRKLISYSRGRIRILDVTRLRAAACSCYRAIRRIEAVKGGR